MKFDENGEKVNLNFSPCGTEMLAAFDELRMRQLRYNVRETVQY